MNSKPDRLLPLERAYRDRLGCSPDQGKRREKLPEQFPQWPIRRVIGRSASGYNLYAISERDIDRYIASCRPVGAQPTDPTFVELGKRGGAATKAKRAEARALALVRSIAESEHASGGAAGNGAGARSKSRSAAARTISTKHRPVAAKSKATGNGRRKGK